jgi:diaminopimelate epimerase
MRVHERGVGPTDACGTGAVAAAAAGREWGLTSTDRVVVRQPGGHAHVDLSGPTATLTVPVVHVARIEVPCP